MRVRVCSAGHDIVLNAFGKPKAVRKLMENTDHKFATVADGVLLYEGDKYKMAEKAMITQCKKAHATKEIQHGHFSIGHHHLIGGRVHNHVELIESRAKIKEG